MKIVFFNIWEEGNTQTELAPCLKELAGDTDVFCFQEAYADMGFLEKEILADYQKVTGYKFLTADDYFRQATYVRSPYHLVSSETLFQDVPGCGLAVSTEIEYAGKRLHIGNVHGISQPGHKLDTPGRFKQSETIIEFFRNKQGLNIIGGDFNILPEARSLRLFEDEGYRDLIKEYRIPTTRNHLAWRKHPTKLYYSDYIFVSPEIKVISFTVPSVEVSDHLPLILEIELLWDRRRL